MVTQVIVYVTAKSIRNMIVVSFSLLPNNMVVGAVFQTSVVVEHTD